MYAVYFVIRRLEDQGRQQYPLISFKAWSTGVGRIYIPWPESSICRIVSQCAIGAAIGL